MQRVVSPHHSTDQNGSAVGEDEREPLGWLTSGSQEWAVGWESPAEFHRAAIVATEATPEEKRETRKMKKNTPGLIS